MPAIRTTKNSAATSAGPSNDPSRPKKSTVNAKYNKGDFLIRSSDNVELRIPSFYLLAASNVLRDAHEIGREGGKFELDEGIPAADLQRWLDIIVERDAPGLETCSSDSICNLLAICDKYDCPAVTKTIHRELKAAITAHPAKTLTFLHATANSSASEVFEHCVRSVGDTPWSASKKSVKPLLLCIESAKVRDLSTWNLVDFRRLPQDYCWAMIRSFRDSKSSDEQADKLKLLLAAIDGTATPPAAAATTPSAST